MAVKKLQEYLENHHVKYTILTHDPAFTAQEIAEKAHISGKNLAKVVLLKVDGALVMVVVLANCQINFDKLKQILKAKQVELAKEAEFKERFPFCELGALPPFGNIYDLPVYVSYEIMQQDSIYFSPGLRAELMQVGIVDFERLVKPKMVTIT